MLTESAELRHLRTFLAVAEHRSFGGAATAIGYTQSAVSQQIAALERAAGTVVFERPGGPQPVRLTEAGRLLAGHARSILKQLAEADHDLAGYREGSRGRLALGSFQSTSVHLLPDVVRALHDELPNVELDLFESDDLDVLLDRIRRRTLDVTFVDHDSYEHEFEQITLFHDPYVAVVPRDRSGDRAMRLDTLDGVPMIAQKSTDGCQQRIDAGLAGAGVRPELAFRSGDNATIQAMVGAGIGIAVLPRLAVDPHDPNIAIRHLDPPIPPRAVGLIWREGRGTPPAVHRFIAIMLELFGDLP